MPEFRALAGSAIQSKGSPAAKRNDGKQKISGYFSSSRNFASHYAIPNGSATPPIEQIGVMYMYSGAWVPDLHGTFPSPDHTYHLGPHAMIITRHNENLAKFNRDGWSTGQIYVLICQAILTFT